MGCLELLANAQGHIVKAAPSDFIMVRRASELPMLLGEPFMQTAHRGLLKDQGEATTEFEAETARWALAQREQLGRSRKGPVHVVEQARMALWAHGIDHGLVVNIGQRNVFTMPVINGHVAAELTTWSEAGSVTLTQYMQRLVMTKARTQDPAAVCGDLLTWCRDMKEQHCYVAPPSPSNQGAPLSA